MYIPQFLQLGNAHFILDLNQSKFQFQGQFWNLRIYIFLLFAIMVIIIKGNIECFGDMAFCNCVRISCFYYFGNKEPKSNGMFSHISLQQLHQMCMKLKLLGKQNFTKEECLMNLFKISWIFGQKNYIDAVIQNFVLDKKQILNFHVKCKFQIVSA